MCDQTMLAGDPEGRTTERPANAQRAEAITSDHDGRDLRPSSAYRPHLPGGPQRPLFQTLLQGRAQQTPA